MMMKNLSKNKLYYLASPYSYVSKNSGFIDMFMGYVVRAYRYKAVSNAAVYLIKQGYMCFEPIATCHHKRGLPTGYSFWQKRDRWFIRKSDGLIVFTLNGWKESEGVTDEINYARSRGLDIIYLDPRDYKTFKEPRKLPKKEADKIRATVTRLKEVK